MKLEWRETPAPGPGQFPGYKARWKRWKFEAWSTKRHTHHLLITTGLETMCGYHAYESIEEAKANAIPALEEWLQRWLDDLKELDDDG